MSRADRAAAQAPSPARGEEAVIVRDAWRSFGGAPAVAGLTFAVAEGEIVACVGVTGAGKSTVLRMVMGAIPPDRGEIRVLGHDPALEFALLRGKIAPVFQTDRLLPWRTARENAALGLEILGVPAAQRFRHAEAWLRKLGLGGAVENLPHQLSGGMRQRVSLARAFALDPQLLLLDEAFSHLDEVTAAGVRADFLALVRPLRTTCLLVTHSVDEAVEVADRILVVGRPARTLAEFPVTAAVRNDPLARDRLRRTVIGHIQTSVHP